MKEVHESIFMSALRAFFKGLFGILGIAIAIVLVLLGYYGFYSIEKEETFSSKIKLLPDAHGDRAKLSAQHPVLLQITLDGLIGSDKLTGKEVEDLLLNTQEEALKERPIKGILLVINSPGGSVNDSDIIYHHIKNFKETHKIPVYVYVDGLCASGGYYIACAADQIYASEVSLVGSIGVLSWPPFMNLVDGLEKIGVSTLTLTAGHGKDEMNPFRAWKPDEQKHYQTLLDYYYEKFVGIVSNQRSIEKETIINTLGAKVFPAPEAAKLGLVILCCTSRNEALKALAKAANIEGKYQVIGFETQSWWKKWLKEESPLVTGKIKHEISLPTSNRNPFSFILAN
jgi:signal peptide peptidase SppA